MRMHPASPATLDARVSIAIFAASSGCLPDARMSIAVLARTTGIIDSPSPVVEQPPCSFSANKPEPIMALSPTRPAGLFIVPPVEGPATKVPPGGADLHIAGLGR